MTSNPVLTRLFPATAFVLILCFIAPHMQAQVYTTKQTRHRFAQLNLGIDYELSLGGKTKFQAADGSISTQRLDALHKPRFVIGGTHFWGHADFCISIPLFYPLMTSGDREMRYARTVETAFKYYPWRIEHHKLRPYIGASFAPVFFQQTDKSIPYGQGPELSRTVFPILGGLNFNHKNHLFEAGVGWNYLNRTTYHISRSTATSIETPPFYLNVSYRFMLETTLSAEKDWESGRTQEVTDRMAEAKRLNGWFVGAGLSSAFWLDHDSYNQNNRPYLGKRGISIMPDFTLGYYWHKPDLNIAIGYRGYRATSEAYGAVQTARRQSTVLEVTKYLFDYHGFVPFIGPAVSWERLHFDESFEEANIINKVEDQLGYGLTFGWDIRPNRIQGWILRTNLRWYPLLNLEVQDAQNVSFHALEFNFIQLIVYPGRMFPRSGKGSE